MPAQVVIPSGWAVLRKDKTMKEGDRRFCISDSGPVWKPVGKFWLNQPAEVFPMVIFKLKARKERGSGSPKRNGIEGGKDNG